MRAEDWAKEIMWRCKVARIATLSRNGRPSITPLYFTMVEGHVWLGTVDWTLAVRNVKTNPHVELLFEVEGGPGDRPVLRMGGRASVRAEPMVYRAYTRRVMLRYVLTPGGLHNLLGHARLLPLRRHYAAQSAAKGRPCVVDVEPERTQLLLEEGPPACR